VDIEAVKSWVRALGVGCLLMATEQAAAITVPLTAEFVPSLDNPSNNTFTNTTGSGAICLRYPDHCDYKRSLGVGGQFLNQTPILANDPNPRQGLTIKVPNEWRDITVRHTTTGETSLVQLRFTGIGGSFRPSPDAPFITKIPDERAAQEALWHDGWIGTAPAPCTRGFGELRRGEISFLWLVTSSASCSKTAAFDIPNGTIYFPEFIYELRTPTPLDMSAGTWVGATSYTMVPGGDIDFGDNYQYSHSVLDLPITLTVSHHLRVVFPPGADRLALEPEGGWIPWLNGGRRPERILRDQPFQFTSSGPVKMRIECCAIANPAGHRVPVETRITLPVGMHELTGGPVSKKLLNSIDEATAVAQQYVADQTGNLHFEVARADVHDMLTYPDTTYSGNVTVVWDSFLIP
jgi:hypothetical protein